MTSNVKIPDELAIEPIYIKLATHLCLNIMKQWQLSEDDMITLVGIESNLLHQWKHHMVEPVALDIYMRITLIIEINKSLRALFSDPAKVRKWITAPTLHYGDISPLNHIIKHGLTGLYEVNAHCRYLAFIKPDIATLH